MADFSQKYHPLFKDSSSSVIPPTSPIKTMGFLEEPNIINAATPFSQFYQPDEHFDDFPDNVCVHETGTCSPQSSKAIDNNCTSGGTKIKCPNSSPNPLDNVEQVSQLVHSPIHNKKRKNKERPSSTSSQSNKKNTSMKEMKGKKQKKDKKKATEETPTGYIHVRARRGQATDSHSLAERKKDKKKATEETPTGYIHVRARRGQATDSHSLAERVRREKISERMKILQGLVPGCDKVNGKALMLEEIINYVQSLQHQVEFLSMKLANVNPMYCDFRMDVDTLPITTKQRLTALASFRPLPPPPPPSMRPCNATHQIPMPNTLNSPTTSSIFGFFDNSALLPIQQEHFTNISTTGSGQLLWDFDEQTIQKLVNKQLSEFTSY